MKFLMVIASVFMMGQSVFAGDLNKITPMDGLPVPFASTNQRVELADGETYGLYGILEYNSKYGMMEFHPDFDVQPWLATQNRKAVGYYPMARYAKNWTTNMDGKYVRMIFRAVGKMYQSEYKISYVIWLDPISSPVETTRPVSKPVKNK